MCMTGQDARPDHIPGLTSATSFREKCSSSISDEWWMLTMMLLLKRAGKQETGTTTVKYFLLPDLPAQFLYGPMFYAVLLANLWRLRRDRPYAVASVGEPSRDY